MDSEGRGGINPEKLSVDKKGYFCIESRNLYWRVTLTVAKNNPPDKLWDPQGEEHALFFFLFLVSLMVSMGPGK